MYGRRIGTDTFFSPSTSIFPRQLSLNKQLIFPLLISIIYSPHTDSIAQYTTKKQVKLHSEILMELAENLSPTLPGRTDTTRVNSDITVSDG